MTFSTFDVHKQTLQTFITFDQRRVRDVMIQELSPLHQRQRVLLARLVRVGDQRLTKRPWRRQPRSSAAAPRRRDPVVVLGEEQPLQPDVGLAPPGVLGVVAGAVYGAELVAGGQAL